MINPNFNNIVLLLNMLVDCHMRRRRDWGTMAAIGRRWLPWSVCSFFASFSLHLFFYLSAAVHGSTFVPFLAIRRHNAPSEVNTAVNDPSQWMGPRGHGRATCGIRGSVANPRIQRGGFLERHDEAFA